jgi:hypothetical protein
MFTGKQIKELVDRLTRREVLLYHSCQFVDFMSYVKLGGIPSRKKLSDCHMSFTRFVSDENDYENGVWDKVFLNPLDFGEIFEHGNGIPTVYGPIHFLINPNALLDAEDVALCVRTASSPGFNRESDSLKDINDVEEIFLKTYSEGAPDNWKIKSRSHLCHDFRKRAVNNPEMSATFPQNLIPLSFVEKVLIDPYIFDGVKLIEGLASTDEVHQSGLDFVERIYHPPQSSIFADITHLLISGEAELSCLISGLEFSPQTKDWAKRMDSDGELRSQWHRYAKYLLPGTIDPFLRFIEDRHIAEYHDSIMKGALMSEMVDQFEDEREPEREEPVMVCYLEDVFDDEEETKDEFYDYSDFDPDSAEAIYALYEDNIPTFDD